MSRHMALEANGSDPSSFEDFWGRFTGFLAFEELEDVGRIFQQAPQCMLTYRNSVDGGLVCCFWFVPNARVKLGCRSLCGWGAGHGKDKMGQLLKT